MTTAFAEEARRVHERGHLSDQLIARATGAARSTVRGWLARRSEPTGQRAERVAELSALVERLARVIKPDYIPGLAHEAARSPRRREADRGHRPRRLSPRGPPRLQPGRARRRLTVALDVDAVAIRPRRWWRHTVHGVDPLARRRPPPDGRWQRGAIVQALYLASDEATVWAEWYRHLAEAGSPAHPADAARSLDLGGRSGPRGRRSHVRGAPEPSGPPGSAPRATDLATYQEVGETLWREGWPGLLASSAARPRDGRVLCLFREPNVGCEPDRGIGHPLRPDLQQPGHADAKIPIRGLEVDRDLLRSERMANQPFSTAAGHPPAWPEKMAPKASACCGLACWSR